MPSREDIDAQRARLQEHRRTLAHLLTQQAALGTVYTPPGVVHGIREARDSIRRIKRWLLSAGVPAEDHPDDEPPASHGSAATTVAGGDMRGSSVLIGNTIGSEVSQQTAGSGTNVFNQSSWRIEGNVYNIAGDLNLGASPTQYQLLDALYQLNQELEKAADLPADEGDDLRSALAAAIKAIARPQPDKVRAMKKLASMGNVIGNLQGTAASALALDKLIGQALRATHELNI